MKLFHVAAGFPRTVTNSVPTVATSAGPDRSNTIIPTAQNLMNLELSYVRFSRFGRLEFGAGFDHLEDKVTGETDREVRGFFKWTVGRDALQ